MDLENMNENDVDGDEEVEADFGINFEVIITREDQPVKMLVDCVAASELEIRNVQMIPKDMETSDLSIYGGPRFDYNNIFNLYIL